MDYTVNSIFFKYLPQCSANDSMDFFEFEFGLTWLLLTLVEVIEYIFDISFSTSSFSSELIYLKQIESE